MAPRAKRRVGIFWDIENCGVPSGIPARTIAARIKAVVKNFGEIVKFNAYGDPRQNRLEVRQEEFREAGVSVIVTPHDAKPQVADMRIIADIIGFALGNIAPAVVILISHDGDFAHAVSIIQDKGHIVWIISNGKSASAKLVALADGRISWNDDIIEKAFEIPRNSEGPQPPDEDGGALGDNRTVNLCENASQVIIGQDLAYPAFPCQTSTTSYHASYSARPVSVQTFTSFSSPNAQLALCSPTAIITSTPFLNTYIKLRKPDPPSVPVTTATAKASGGAPPKMNSLSRFNPLISLLRELRETDPRRSCSLRGPEVAAMLKRRDPSQISSKPSKSKAYLNKALKAGIVVMHRDKGRAPTISLHPDYY